MRSMPAWRAKCFGDGQPLRDRERIGRAPAEREPRRAGGLRRERENRRAVLHQHFIGLVRPVPLDQGELGMMQRAALAVAERAGELDDPGLAGRQELLAGEFGRGSQIKPLARWPRAPPGRSRRRADGSRCPARARVPTSPPRRSPAPRRTAAAPPRCARAPTGTAADRHAGPRTASASGRSCGRPGRGGPPTRKSLAQGRKISMVRPTFGPAAALAAAAFRAIEETRP